MKGLQSTTFAKVRRGAVVTVAATALAVTGAMPAGANELTPDRPGGDQVQQDPKVLAALQRDLGMSEAEVHELLADLTGVDALEAELADELGTGFGGAWFDHDTRTLKVAVTDAGQAGLARAAGADTELVTYSYERLESVTDELDALLEEDPDALAEAYSWSVDVTTNQVVVTVASGAAGEVAELVADHGDAVRIEESAHAPEPAQSQLYGGTAYNGCSVGFNASAGATRYFLTAGHCGSVGQQTSQNGVNIGPFVESWFPTYDDALVRVDNTGAWAQGPYVWVYSGTVTINGWTDAAVGTPVCASGRTTGLTCGVIRAKNETVNYSQGAVHGMTRHSACVEPGDSGGSNFNTVGGNYAEGVTSGAQMIGGQCLEKHGYPESVSWYYPMADSLSYYGSAYGLTLMTG